MFHFISGLPRSGSTLLAGILRQNQRFHAHIESPVGRMVTELHRSMGVVNESEYFIDDAARVRVLRGVFKNYYGPEASHVIFDNNRRWCANIELLLTLFPDMRILACVRHPAHIMDSFERLLCAHPLAVSAITGGNSNMNVYERARWYLTPDGVLGYALNALRMAWYGAHRDRLILVRYDDLCRFPKETLADVHKLLGEKPFKYDFENIEPISGTKEFDARLGTPGLHDLKKKVVYEARTAVIPPDIFQSLPKPFWDPPDVKEVDTKPV